MQTLNSVGLWVAEILHFYSLPGDTDVAAPQLNSHKSLGHLVGSVSDLRTELLSTELLSTHYVSWRVFSELHSEMTFLNDLTN